MKKLLYTPLFFWIATFLMHCAGGNQARRAYDAKDYRRTLALCREALSADSSDVSSMLLMAESYAALDSFENARNVLERAARTGLDETQRVHASNLYFELAERTSGNSDVLDCLEKAEALSPRSKDVLERLARLYEKAGELEEAYDRYDRLVMLARDPTEYGFITNSLANKIEFAKEACDKAMQSYRQKQYRDASLYFAKAVEAYPGMNEAVYYLHLSKVNIIKRNPNKMARKQARKYLSLATEARPEKAEPHFLMARFYEMENDRNLLDEAIYHYSLSLKLEPNGPFAEKSRDKIRRLKKRKATLDAFWGRTAE